MASYRDRLPVVGGGGAVIKSVQRGSGTVRSGTNTTAITISSVDTTKTYVKIFWNAQYVGTELETYTTTSIRISSPTQIVAQRFASPSNQSINFNWEVVEFISGVSVQSGTLTTSSTTPDATISSIDQSKSQLFYSVRSSATDGVLSNKYIGSISSANAISFIIGSSLGSSSTIQWQVVTYV